MTQHNDRYNIGLGMNEESDPKSWRSMIIMNIYTSSFLSVCLLLREHKCQIVPNQMPVAAPGLGAAESADLGESI